MKKSFILFVLMTSTLLAHKSGCWDCIGLTDREISQLLAYDDYDSHVGPNCDSPNEAGYFGAEGSPSSGDDSDGPGVHAG